MAKSVVYILEVCAHVKHIKKKYTFSQDKHPFSEYGTYTRPLRHAVCIHKKLEKYPYLVGGIRQRRRCFIVTLKMKLN